ncbi:hypothetical protein TIFTF001_009935 [Ficus carica]|uniref:Uncharacterized protein n=1 Tax=Ficus carica TaxID=3494 RepID=A0AA87ZUL2_FICCA|nr:hypothetical protein TIFTF001_009935 [Ficus carica]
MHQVKMSSSSPQATVPTTYLVPKGRNPMTKIALHHRLHREVTTFVLLSHVGVVTIEVLWHDEGDLMEEISVIVVVRGRPHQRDVTSTRSTTTHSLLQIDFTRKDDK